MVFLLLTLPTSLLVSAIYLLLWVPNGRAEGADGGSRRHDVPFSCCCACRLITREVSSFRGAKVSPLAAVPKWLCFAVSTLEVPRVPETSKQLKPSTTSSSTTVAKQRLKMSLANSEQLGSVMGW
jgi:hypothetical protein